MLSHADRLRGAGDFSTIDKTWLDGGIMKAWAIVALLISVASLPVGAAESPGDLPALPYFVAQQAGQPIITADIMPVKPFTVVGPRGALLGQQDGSFEAWIFPWKIFSHMRITAEMKDYAVPIDVNEQASTIDVQPGHTTITFSHANFTLREILFAPQQAPEGGGALGFFQIKAVRPMTLTFSFTPEMLRMWPALSDDRPSPEWVKTGASGFYVLHLNFPDHAGAVAMPTAQYGIMAPYQERPKNYPLQFVIHFDPATDRDKIYPLLMTTADTAAAATTPALASKLQALDDRFREIYTDTQNHFQDFSAQHLSIDTPDQTLNQAFTWAEVAIDQLRVETIPSHSETALVAGFYTSGDSARPGFGWYFGRDALWTLYAVNSYGDYQLTRDELNFLIKRQSPEGRMIHEWSQTADLVDWKSLPYAYASADANPLFLMAADDYLKVSGDTQFIQTNWEALERAWTFEITHDSDGDGIYENTEGSGWVESWPPGMPHQEIYLAALDQQASTAMAALARATGHQNIAQQAETRAAKVGAAIEKEYLLAGGGFYAFSRNADGSTDPSPTIFPAVASWDGTYRLQHAQPMFDRWAAEEFSTDWGTRDLSPTVSFYDPISYHQGTVWPLYTGWVALSEYRNGRSLSAYAHLMQNADLTWAQDPGAVTELLSGEFFSPLGRSTSHQLWSSAMVISPVVRGLFGLEWDAANHQLMVTPSLPADWDKAQLHHVPLGSSHVDLEMTRVGTMLTVRATGAADRQVLLASHAPGAKAADNLLRIPLPAVEVAFAHALPEPGATTQQMKVIDQQSSANSLTLTLSGIANTRQTLMMRVNDVRARPHVDGAQVAAQSSNPSLRPLEVQFGPGEGYVERKVKVTW
jgi:glycogen debranching enzyme